MYPSRTGQLNNCKEKDACYFSPPDSILSCCAASVSIAVIERRLNATKDLFYRKDGIWVGSSRRVEFCVEQERVVEQSTGRDTEA